MIERLKGAYRKLPPIGKYLLFSVLVTLVDAALSWLLSMRLEVRLPGGQHTLAWWWGK